MEKLKKNKTLCILFGSIFIVALLLTIMLVPRLGKKTINLNDYLVMDYSGINGYGQAKLSVNKELLKKDYNVEYKNIDNAYLNYVDPLDTLLLLIKYDMDKSSELSNGDSIHVTFTCPDNLQNSFNVKIKCGDQDFEVSGLTEVVTYDPFENVNVTFSGKQGSAEYKIDSSMAGIPNLRYYISQEELNQSKNGDAITIKLSKDYSDDAGYMNQYGKVPAYFEKEITIEGLSVPVTDFSQLNDENMEYLKTVAKEAIEMQTSGKFVINSAEFVNAFDAYHLFFGDENNIKNRIYVLYEMNVTNIKDDTTETIYCAGIIETVYVGGDGIDENLIQSGYDGSGSSVKIGNRSISAFKSYDEFVEHILKKHRDRNIVSYNGDIIRNVDDGSSDQDGNAQLSDDYDDLPDAAELPADDTFSPEDWPVNLIGLIDMPDIFTISALEKMPAEVRSYLNSQGYEDAFNLKIIKDSIIEDRSYPMFQCEIEDTGHILEVRYELAKKEFEFKIY